MSSRSRFASKGRGRITPFALEAVGVRADEPAFSVPYPVWLRCLIATAYLLSVAKILPRRTQRWAATILAGWAIRHRTRKIVELRTRGLIVSPIGSVATAKVAKAVRKGQMVALTADGKVRPARPASALNRRQRRAAKAKAGKGS